MNVPLKLLVIEDNPADFLLLERHLRKQGLEAACTRVASTPELEDALDGHPWTTILADYNMPGMMFEPTLDLIRNRRPDLPVILVSGTVGEERAVELLKRGVWDFILKDNLARLIPAIERCLREAAEQRARQAAETALRESEIFKQTILDSVSSHLAVLDRAGAIVVVNGSWRRFARENGVEPGQPARRTEVGVNYLAVCREASGEWSEGAMAAHDGIQAVLAGRLSCFTLEYPCHSPNEQRWFAMTATPLETGDGGAVIAHTAITERKRAELALEREHGFLKTLVRTVPDLVWLKDPEGVFLACNPRFEQFYGAREAEILGKTDYDFVDRELADFFRAKDCSALTTGKPSVNEEEVTFADDGHRELLETIKTPMFDAEGRLIGVLGVARDITVARQTEATWRCDPARRRIATRHAAERMDDTRVHAMRGLADQLTGRRAILHPSTSMPTRKPSSWSSSRCAHPPAHTARRSTTNTIRSAKPGSGPKPCARRRRWCSTTTPARRTGAACRMAIGTQAADQQCR